jgi:uncharacterized protein YjlB
MSGAAVEAIGIAPDGEIPNSHLPLLVARDALPTDARTAAKARRLIENAGWTGTWTYTVFPFWHFHTAGHEVLACISGEALIGFGGDGGPRIWMRVGDAVLIPAGVGHRRFEGGDGFQVCGGYPPGQSGEIVRPGELNADAIREALGRLSLPTTDPLTGERDGLLVYWR